MAISEAVSRSLSEACSPPTAQRLRPEAPEASSSGGRHAALVVAMLLTLGLVGVLGYTQWWVPREQAQQVARLNYDHCLVEVKAYRGKHSYKARLAQCNAFLSG